MLFFLWNDQLEEHAERHGVMRADAELVVRNARDPYPEPIGDDKYRVWGRTRAGQFVQVIFVWKELDAIEWRQFTLPMLAAVWDDDAIFVVVIHAMPMTAEMKRRYRGQA
ncbi:MAG TPA: hypothetical protein VK797_07715 [Tepidisphaeraceae bacterium]|nr:hypothetical protein [Tepidisphaeraceae bacterium]